MKIYMKDMEIGKKYTVYSISTWWQDTAIKCTAIRISEKTVKLEGPHLHKTNYTRLNYEINGDYPHILTTRVEALEIMVQTAISKRNQASGALKRADALVEKRLQELQDEIDGKAS